jgi:hypothetical protein
VAITTPVATNATFRAFIRRSFMTPPGSLAPGHHLDPRIFSAPWSQCDCRWGSP